MPYPTKLDENRLHIFHEGRKRRIFVGELIHDKKKDVYQFIYDKSYVQLKNAIPIGADLSLFELKHTSKKGKLFASFIDRLPDKDNPAYKDYCEAQNISPEEKNLIILLGSIGKRGPSNFIFEPVYHNSFNRFDIINFRNKLEITQHDLATAFNISKSTLQRIESGESNDPNILKLIQIFIEFHEVRQWQLKETQGYMLNGVLGKLMS